MSFYWTDAPAACGTYRENSDTRSGEELKWVSLSLSKSFPAKIYTQVKKV